MSTRKVVSVRQLEVLADYLSTHSCLAVGRMKSKEGRALTQRLWQGCAKILNKETDGLIKTAKEWQKWYTDYKSRLLNRERQIKLNTAEPDGGVSINDLYPIEKRLCSIIHGKKEVLTHNGTPLRNVIKKEVTDEEYNTESADDQNSKVNTAQDQNIYDLPVEIVYDHSSSSPIQEAQNEQPLKRNLKRKRRPRALPQEKRSSIHKELQETTNSLLEVRQQLVEIESIKFETAKIQAEAMKNQAEAMNNQAAALQAQAAAFQSQAAALQNMCLVLKDVAEAIKQRSKID